ncbi:phage tail protein [Streptomyces sp. NPDC046866]|uniref:phage tail protein n=1 Tax=Streptomyces sp. NPDC046866 TaxID=3154921 RepID=UPI003452EE3C
MHGDRTTALLADPDQWLRCRHESTALLDGGGVQLAWEPEPEPEPESERDPGPGPEPGAGAAAGVGAGAGAGAGPTAAAGATAGAAAGHGPAGLAFDRWGRAYRSHPRDGRVDVLPPDGTGTPAAGPPRPGTLCVPRGLAVDAGQRLHIAESGAGCVHVVDLWGERLLRRVPVRTPAHPHRRPLDLTAHCGAVAVLATRPAGLLLIHGRRGPQRGPALHRPPGAEKLRPTRIADHAGLLHVLWTGPVGGRAVAARADGTLPLTVEGGTDLCLTPDGALVVARGPGRPFRRFRPDGTSWSEIEPLYAPGYDGGALTVDPDGRIAFTTADGTGRTAGPAARYTPAGTVLCYRLDAGEYRTRWGRLFLDACIPPGTEVKAAFLTDDEDTVPDPLPWQPPVRGPRAVRRPDLTPPLPSAAARAARLAAPAPLFRRPTGRELPWTQIDPDDGFETYEAPVQAPPGRYLWIVLRLTGTLRVTPRIRALRVERPGHRLAAALPRAWSRDEADAAFLQRFLAPAEGLLHELDSRAALRTLLLDPRTTPQEALGWLAGLLGLALDRRWPVPARRALIAQAYDLFRIRGTAACLERILRLYLPVPVSVVEHWRLRGLGGAVLGTAPGGPPAPAVGGAARTSGALGRFTVGGTRPGEDGYTATAHRFSVLIAAAPSPAQLDVVRAVVEAHKPAHTRVDICPLGAGMRIGRALHLGLTSVVGPGAAWAPAVVGRTAVGTDGIVGVPAAGSRVGESTIAGAVRVG